MLSLGDRRSVHALLSLVAAAIGLTGCGAPAVATASDESDIKMVGAWCAEPYLDQFSGQVEGSTGEAHDGLPDNGALDRATPLAALGDGLTDRSHWLTAVLSPGDVDWYSFDARDESSQDLEPEVELIYGGSGGDNMFRPGSDNAATTRAMFDVCAYSTRNDVRCTLGTQDGISVYAEDGSLQQSLYGCGADLVSPRGWPAFELMFSGLDTWFGDDGTKVYLRVKERDTLQQDACYRMNLAG